MRKNTKIIHRNINIKIKINYLSYIFFKKNKIKKSYLISFIFSLIFEIE